MPRLPELHSLLWSATIAAAIAAVAPVPLPAGIAFRGPIELHVAGRLHEVRVHDLNGDGLPDVIALSETPEAGDPWRASLFFQRPGGGFEGGPDDVLAVDSSIVLLALGDPPPGPGRLVGISAAGVRALYPPASSPDGFVARHESALVPAFRDRPIFFDGFRDWDGDGREEILLFDFTGISFLEFPAGGMPGVTDPIPLRPRLRVDRAGVGEGAPPLLGDTGLLFRYHLPKVKAGEYDGDGRPDLFLVNGDRLFVSIQGGGGRWGTPIAVRDFTARGIDPDRGFSSRLRLDDLDGDGLMDVADVRWIGTGLSETVTEIRVYRGRGETGFPEAPDDLLRVENAIPGIVLFEDLDGDGRREIEVPTMNLGIMAFVRILTSGALKLRIRVFDDRPGGGYEDTPRYVHALSAHFEISGNTRIAAGLDDFDGDGLPDFVFGTRKDEISFFRGMGGRGNRILSREPVRVLREDARGFLRTDDLNGDGRHDLLLYYPAAGRIRIYLADG